MAVPSGFRSEPLGSSGLDIGVDAHGDRLAVHRHFGCLVAIGRGNHQSLAGRRTNRRCIHRDSQNQKAVLDFRFHNCSKVKGRITQTNRVQLHKRLVGAGVVSSSRPRCRIVTGQVRRRAWERPQGSRPRSSFPSVSLAGGRRARSAHARKPRQRLSSGL